MFFHRFGALELPYTGPYCLKYRQDPLTGSRTFRYRVGSSGPNRSDCRKAVAMSMLPTATELSSGTGDSSAFRIAVSPATFEE